MPQLSTCLSGCRFPGEQAAASLAYAGSGPGPRCCSGGSSRFAAVRSGSTMRRNVRLMRSLASAGRRGTLCIQPSCRLPDITSRAPPPSLKRYLSAWSALRRSKKSREAPSETEAANAAGAEQGREQAIDKSRRQVGEGEMDGTRE